MPLTVTLHNTNGEQFSFTNLLTFQLKKNVYLPYTSFSVQLNTDSLSQFGTINRVVVQLGQRIYHEGSLEEMTVQNTANGTVLSLQSYGFTKLLLQNELEPGLYPNISLDHLFSHYDSFPSTITWESNHDASNYIYIKENMTIWNGIVTLCYKLTQRYPYIRGSNQVCIHLPDSPRTLRVLPEQTLSYGTKRQYRKLISHFHMQDVDGSYNKYVLANNQALAVYQVRHKYITLDRSYLYDPQQALVFRSKQSQNGWFSRSVTMSGMLSFDLNDILTVQGQFEQATISEILWQGTEKGITTTLSSYFDAFQNA